MYLIRLNAVQSVASEYMITLSSNRMSEWQKKMPCQLLKKRKSRRKKKQKN